MATSSSMGRTASATASSATASSGTASSAGAARRGGLAGLAAGLVVGLFAAGCAGESDAGPAVTYHRDIAPILEGRCVGCHSEGGIGGFSLATYEAASAMRKPIGQRVAEGTMPPWYADPGVRTYLHDPSLTDAQKAAIATWVELGAPEGDPKDKGTKLDAVGVALPRVDRVIQMAEAYTPTKKPDDYRCFVVDFPLDKPTYVTGFNVRPGNLSIAHHTALFVIPPKTPIGISPIPLIEGLDKDEPGYGYTCYGGPTGSSGLPVPIQQLGQWVPGASALVFPEGTGILVEPGSKLVLQMHYFIPPSHDGETDTTEIDLMMADKVDHEAAFAPWLNHKWVTSSLMKIEAGNAAVEHTHKDDPRDFFPNFIGGLQIEKGFRIHSAMLHEHQLGVGGEIAVHHPDGSVDMVLKMSRYDFNWQRVYELAEPVLFSPGDELRVTCRWDNSEAHQPTIDGKRKTSADVKWGEGTGDEMCVGNLFISELD